MPPSSYPPTTHPNSPSSSLVKTRTTGASATAPGTWQVTSSTQPTHPSIHPPTHPPSSTDVFHTFFGIAGLSLLHFFEGGGQAGQYQHYRPIDAVYALPVDVVERLGLRSEVLL